MNSRDMIIRSVPRRDFMQLISIYSINSMAIMFAIINHSIAITASVSLLFIDSWLTTINVSQLTDLKIHNLHSKAMHANQYRHTPAQTYTHAHTHTYTYVHTYTY